MMNKEQEIAKLEAAREKLASVYQEEATNDHNYNVMLDLLNTSLKNIQTVIDKLKAK